MSTKWKENLLDKCVEQMEDILAISVGKKT